MRTIVDATTGQQIEVEDDIVAVPAEVVVVEVEPQGEIPPTETPVD